MNTARDACQQTKGVFVKIWGLRVVVALGILIPGSHAIAVDPVPNERGTAVGGTVVAESSPWAWVSDPSGVVTAIDLADGSSRWYGPARGLPLALHNGELVVLSAPSGAGKLALVIVNPQTGAVDRGFSTDLPDTVVASPVPLPGQRFQAWSSIDNDELTITWEYQSAPLRGMEMAHDDTPSRVQTLEGALVLDLTNETARSVPVNSELRRFDLAASGRLAHVQGTQFRSADSLHVLAATPIEDNIFGWKWQWQLHERSSGRALGSITTPLSTAPYVVLEDRVIWLSDPISAADSNGKLQSHGSRMIAQQITDGAVLWTVDIAERLYQGSMPP